MLRSVTVLRLLPWVFAALTACERQGPPAMSIDVLALGLDEVGDAVWDLEVDAGADVVWQARVTASRFGDGGGSVAYVGTCDASAPTNRVKLWLVGLYDGPVASAGGFAAGDAGAVVGAPLDLTNPTADGPLVRDVPCAPNADNAVRFDVTVMRRAEQGFFDLAVSFNDIYCAAKLDCCADAGGDGCAADGSEDVLLLHDETGRRARTIVMGFACAAGAGATTDLYLDALELDCDVGTGPEAFAPDLSIDPASADSGNLCVAGAVEACDAVQAGPAVDADAYLYQVAVYHQVAADTPSGTLVQWNTALGVRGAIAGCRLRVRGTADDADDVADQVVDGTIAAGIVYPVITWDVDLGACGAEALSYENDGPVSVRYTSTDGGPTGFAYHFGAGPAGPFCDPACGPGLVCAGGTCVTPERDPPAAPVITSPASPHLGNSLSLALAGTCTSGMTVTIDPDDATDPGVATATTPCTDGAFEVALSGGEGEHVYALRQLDPVSGLTSTPVSFAWTIDLTAPAAVVVDSPAANPYASGFDALELGGACEPGATVVLGGDGPDRAAACDGRFAFTIARAVNGTFTFTLGVVDQAGNVGPDVGFTWTRDDTTPDAPTITSPGANLLSNGDTVALEGTCTVGSPVTITLGGWSDTAPCAGTFAFTLTQSVDGIFAYTLGAVNPHNGQSSAPRPSPGSATRPHPPHRS